MWSTAVALHWITCSCPVTPGSLACVRQSNDSGLISWAERHCRQASAPTHRRQQHRDTHMADRWIETRTEGIPRTDTIKTHSTEQSIITRAACTRSLYDLEQVDADQLEVLSDRFPNPGGHSTRDGGVELPLAHRAAAEELDSSQHVQGVPACDSKDSSEQPP